MTFMVAGALLPGGRSLGSCPLLSLLTPTHLLLAAYLVPAYRFAYSMLIPAYFSMWISGRLSRPHLTANLSGFAVFFGFAMLGTAFCELISSGSFYLWSGNFEPTLSEFISRELKYAPAAFSSSAYWAIAFIAGSAIYAVFIAPESQRSLLNGDGVVGLEARLGCRPCA